MGQYKDVVSAVLGQLDRDSAGGNMEVGQNMVFTCLVLPGVKRSISQR